MDSSSNYNNNNNNAWMINQSASTHAPSVYSHFTHQAGYTVQEPVYGHFGQYNVYQHPPFPSSSLSHVMRDTIQREIEKERIREHIIVSEITNRRALEAEIRRELMMFDAELARRRESNALLLGLPPVSGHMEGVLVRQRQGNALLLDLPPVTGPMEGTVAQGRSVHETVAVSLEKKEALNAVSHETLPFQRGLKSPDKKEILNAATCETLTFQRGTGGLKSPEKKKPLNAVSRETLPFQRGAWGRKFSEKKEMLDAVSREMLPFQKGAGDLKSPEKKEMLNAVSRETLPFQRRDGELKSPEKKETLNAVSRKTLPFQRGVVDLKSLDQKEMLDAISRKTLPFQRGAGDLKVSEVKPVNNATEKGKEVKIDLPAKPKTNISGSKRKAVTPPLPDNEGPSGSKLNKKAKKGWSCGLCQVTVTSETTLHMHLFGKKHKMKEESLQAQISGTVGPLRKTPVSNNVVETATDTHKPQDLSANNDGLLANPKPGKKVETVEKVRKNVDPKKTYYTFWCNMCKVGAMTKNIIDAHRKGKKHIKTLKEVKNAKPGKCNKNEKK